ncbi:MAG: hypothetical protein GF329_21000 [Candidatus Lokiarchaeota archaeon]|nr:hypothetical protein [Candidatus Lokiarchaeota archaeon]
MKIAHLKEGWRIYKRRRRVNKKGLHTYEGNAAEICEQIIEDCWNGTYFQTSTDYGHYCEFYMRDFGWAIESLLELGHKERVIQTLEYALDKYSNQGLTTTINPKGKCIDIFKYSPDSLAYLIRCLRIAEASDLIEKHEPFLIKEINMCFDRCFDKNTSLIRDDVHWGSMKDSTHRNCSTYDNIMLAMVSKDLNHLHLPNPFKDYDIKSAILNNLWNGEYFYDDIHKHELVTGDNNTFPYWTGIFKNENMIKSSIKSIQSAELDSPFPLKYSNKKISKEVFWRKWFVSDYQTHSIKTHMGAIYIHMVKKFFPSLAKIYIDKYTELIETHGTYLENYTSKGEPLNTKFYYSDEGNLWSANYLTLL